MSGWRLSGLLVVLLFGTLVNSKLNLDSPLSLAHCRATCLHKVHVPLVTDFTCQASVSCSQCWQTCEVLQSSRSICSQHACGQGCLEACRFKSSSSSQQSPVLLTNHEEILGFNSSKVFWPITSSPDITVYVVMGREANKPWSQIHQTLDTSARIPPTMDLDTVRVLVVGWTGLTKVYSPPRTESPVVEAQKVIRSLRLQNRMGFKHPENQRFLQDDTFNNLKLYDTEDRSWVLREISMIHQSALVLAQISWNPQHLDPDYQLMYLVTWEVEGGVLRGNLVTNSTCVTLSLWQDTKYKIQVEVLSPGVSSSRSEPLALDTHHVYTESPGFIDHLSGIELIDVHTGMVVGVAMAVAFFLMVTLALTWRWHHRLSLPHFKLVDENIGTPNISRVFPPAIRLLSESSTKPDISSSTNNLLQAVDAGTRN